MNWLSNYLNGKYWLHITLIAAILLALLEWVLPVVMKLLNLSWTATSGMFTLKNIIISTILIGIADILADTITGLKGN